MPSDPRVTAAMERLAPRAEPLRAALAEAAAEVRAWLATQSTNGTARRALAEAQLGPFGAAHIAVERFTALFPDGETLTGATRETAQAALDALTELAAGTRPVAVHVHDGHNLARAVDKAFGQAGRGFAAARLLARARGGRLGLEESAPPSTFGFEGWSRAERRLAPPLVVSVDGADLDAGALARFLDGRVAIVLAVRGAAAPAALVRLLTPGLFVMQTTDAADLDRLAAFDGPAVAALVDERAARFVHDPGSGAAMHERLRVSFRPERPVRAIGPWSVAQQAAELQQLEMFAARPPATPAAAAAVPAPAADPADRLAAWLLQQADLSDMG